MQVTLGGWLSYCHYYPLCNWEAGMGFLLQNWSQSAWAGAYFALLQFLSSLSTAHTPQCEQCSSKERRKSSCVLRGSISMKGNDEPLVLGKHELQPFFWLGPHDCTLQYWEPYFNNIYAFLSFLSPIISNKQFLLVSRPKYSHEHELQEALQLDKI